MTMSIPLAEAPRELRRTTPISSTTCRKLPRTQLSVDVPPNPRPARTPDTTHRARDQYRDVPAQCEAIAQLDASDPRREVLRERLIERCLPLAEHIARRFHERGEPLDDLIQVARLGLVKAVDRFDASYGANFVSFAVPTITGEVRRHFRDTGWAMRVPRSMQELHLALMGATKQLTTTLGRAPTASELAKALDIDKSEVLEGLRVANAYSTLSVDYPLTDDERPLSETLGDIDPALSRVEDHVTVQPLLDALPDLERTVLVLRFFGNMTQSQIAARVGVSQMQISRLLAKTLKDLRTKLE
ncbi:MULTISPECIES: SigB/SigF/SigG family RNA polymerase sigma factor [Rhodococcus]|uniref:SigB/SigF/SigG family RNA polymerase sigma factor n=1 Tax=Rhodococcus oxybenzonivorans TaxID=1990687 RepID=A0AAE4V2G2_9NOCA|nr:MULTISPECIES: SigB/SigF/SigG family RNA polymerase sigma factor [Rhodococcus]MDV7241018.1 SigB/SigF/SigG family RNA polymerase sigma factor [Rhodococcus oxybenzonivorans]MDV7267328.1 SigB/SigF/SigG family RNA polymerase sigma factor [Rhodococcus oxybenzonivorans]MDV7273291.1 SigB/SigF/SigG family RNA polymerase sigma factor [Rhodococcus oxybenzonivorans]MDV7332971.1 SigB/SigF/SigG family RNA polymerase sigma factor [Rhodococcus oxybenzonivorans]MDV7342137.1 SigB/SigF/SigG family RNA polymer